MKEMLADLFKDTQLVSCTQNWKFLRAWMHSHHAF